MADRIIITRLENEINMIFSNLLHIQRDPDRIVCLKLFFNRVLHVTYSIMYAQIAKKTV